MQKRKRKVEKLTERAINDHKNVTQQLNIIPHILRLEAQNKQSASTPPSASPHSNPRLRLLAHLG